MTEQNTAALSRREFLILLAFWSGWVSLGIVLLESLQEPGLTLQSEQVLLDQPNKYALNSVSFFPLYRAWLIRKPEGFYALKAVCPHLGCQPKWTQDKFACPCHGSHFDREGKVKQGPSLYSLERFHIFITSQEKIGLDLSRTYSPETDNLSQTGAFLPWPT